MDSTAVSAELSPAIAQAIDRGATIVTVNQRAARWIRQTYDRVQRADGISSWQPPNVLAWDSWMAALWQEMLIEGRTSSILLNRTQEHHVWHSIIAGDRKNLDVLRSVDSLAELAAEAWRLVAQYRAVSRLANISANFETRSYLRWAGEFERHCRMNQWISIAKVEEALLETIRLEMLRVSEVLLVGFDDLAPARRILIDTMISRKINVSEMPVEAVEQNLSLVVADDEGVEIAAAARWSRKILQGEPHKKLAVIVPSLETKRSAIDRVFRETLSPELENIAAQNEVAPYEFSVGIPLAQTPLVRVAIELLHWAKGPLPVERVSALLVSPLLFAMKEQDADVCSTFDAFEVRKAKMLLRPEIGIRWLLGTSSRSKRRKLPPKLLQALEGLSRIAAGYGIAAKRLAYGQWAEIFRAMLREVEWGYREGENSIEFQTRKRWESSLDELTSLDFMGHLVSYNDALSSLEKIAQAKIFAPESRQAPVQILGPLESAGSSFDAIWFMGAGDLTWPGKHSYSPLLPWGMQKELGMPGELDADGERNHKLALRISGSASSVVFSYANESSSGTQRLSSTVALLNPLAASLEVLAPGIPDRVSVALEEYFDITPLPATPDAPIHGGAEILRLQAACGFRAFTERRLFATELKNITLGMDYMERGTIVHSALEFFWRDIRSQENLLSMTADERGLAVDRAVDESIQRLRQQTVENWEAAYIEVQRGRLRSLISNWLDVEMNRQPFEVAQSEKEFKNVPIGPLQLTVRVDRVDHTESGDVIIDYKTGSASPADWLTDRPDAPQLPLYAVISSALHPENELADIAFSKVHAGNDAIFDSYEGKVTAEKWGPNKKRPAITSQLEDWRSVLVGLAEDFHLGDARVDPKLYPNTCKYCALRTFCRLDPAAIEIDEEMNDQSEID